MRFTLSLVLCLLSSTVLCAQEKRILQDRTAGSPQFAVYSSDGRFVAVGFGIDVRVWELASRRRIADFETNALSAVFSADNQALVTRGSSGNLTVWSLASSQKMCDLPFPAYALTSQFSPDGKHLAIAGVGGLLRLWDASTGKEAATLQTPSIAPHSLALSPDGKVLAAGAREGGIVLLWDAVTGQLQQTLSGHNKG